MIRVNTSPKTLRLSYSPLAERHRQVAAIVFRNIFSILYIAHSVCLGNLAVIHRSQLWFAPAIRAIFAPKAIVRNGEDYFLDYPSNFHNC